MTKLIHADLTYAVRGVMFDVHSKLGPDLPESFYRNAISQGLEKLKIPHQAEKDFNVYYRGVEVGRYYVDIWLGKKLLLELKVRPKIDPIHQAQAISYLKITDCDLAIIANFGQTSLETLRLPNYLRENQPIFNWQSSSNIHFPEPANVLLQALHRIHFELGIGYFHQVYRRALRAHLAIENINHEYIKETPIYYDGELLGYQKSRLILVENRILVATIAVREVTDVMKAHLKAKMRHHKVPFAILANFKAIKLETHFLRQTRTQK